MASVYQIVTDKILAKLEQGEIPWRKPWVGGQQPVNWLTQKPYRGINSLLLDPGEYATFNQVKKHNGKVKKGEKGQLVVFWKWIEIKENDNETGEEEVKQRPLLRYYKVFEINSQVEGLESREKDRETYDHDPIEQAEAIVKGYKDRPEIKYAPGRACYNPMDDQVKVPEISDFPNADEYYDTLFHELAHSTGHNKRLNRQGVNMDILTGRETYAKEELVAEIAAAMLCGQAGISNDRNLENTAAYLQGWKKAIKDDASLMVCSAGQAQKAADYIIGACYSE